MMLRKSKGLSLLYKTEILCVLGIEAATQCQPGPNLQAEYIMENAGLDEAQAGIKIVRRNSNNLMQMKTTIRQKAKKK